MGAKYDERTDAWSHHAKDAAGAEHRTGSIRIRARPPQAQIPREISISIHAEPSNDAIDHRHALSAEGVNVRKAGPLVHHMVGTCGTLGALPLPAERGEGWGEGQFMAPLTRTRSLLEF